MRAPAIAGHALNRNSSWLLRAPHEGIREVAAADARYALAPRLAARAASSAAALPPIPLSHLFSPSSLSLSHRGASFEVVERNPRTPSFDATSDRDSGPGPEISVRETRSYPRGREGRDSRRSIALACVAARMQIGVSGEGREGERSRLGGAARGRRGRRWRRPRLPKLPQRAGGRGKSGKWPSTIRFPIRVWADGCAPLPGYIEHPPA